jgi:uncharacterized protein
MRTFDRALGVALIGLGIGLAPAHGFDGNPPAHPQLQSLPSPGAPLPGTQSKPITSLEYAAEKGEATAQWRLGYMYANGEGVPRSDRRAFEYFGQIANGHAEDSPDSPSARLVASAFVALGQYYLVGIPDADVKPDAIRARHLFFYAATYFADPDAQYRLGRMLLEGVGGAKEPRQAARWLKLAANKDQHSAQAILGEMLFKGDQVPRQAAKGLMYLIIARENAGGDEHWITPLYEAALAQASDDDRAAARLYLQQWVRGARD